MAGRFALRLAVCVTVMGVAPSIRAQDANDMATARALGTAGLKLAEEGNCAAAVDKLARAEKLFHAPTTAARLGECQIALGHLVEGTETLRRVVRERLADSAPAAFAAAQARAAKALEAALPHLGKLKVDIAGPAADDVTLKIDGLPVSSATIGVERPIDPGSHTLEASATGFRTASGTVKVNDGGSETIQLSLERDPNAQPPSSDATVHPQIEVVPAGQSHTVTQRQYWPAGIAFGVAGAGVVLTGVFGGLALGKKGDLTSLCSGTSCPGSAYGTYNDASTFSSVANVGLIVAGVAAVAGVVLVLVAPSHTVVSPTARGATLGGVF